MVPPVAEYKIRLICMGTLVKPNLELHLHKVKVEAPLLNITLSVTALPPAVPGKPPVPIVNRHLQNFHYNLQQLELSPAQDLILGSVKVATCC